MKKNSFVEGAMVATIGIIIVKIIGILYVIPFNALIGEQGGALYGYGYNIYQLFLSISTAGFPFAISKMTSEYLANGDRKAVLDTYKISKNIILLISFITFLILFIFSSSIATFIIGSSTGGNSLEDISFVIKLVSFSILIVPFLSVTKGFLQGQKFITPTSISQIIEQVVRVLVILIGSYVTLHILNLELKYAVGISVFAAFLGGLVAYIYLKVKISKNKLLVNIKEKSNVPKKEIIKKLISYSIPFILISLVYNLYNTVDMILISRTMNDILKYNSSVTESVIGVFTTWGAKLNNILLAITTGITTSLIPNIVESFTKNDMEDVNNKFNKALQFILLIIVPMTLFLSFLSYPVWTLFFGESISGPVVFKMFVFYALFGGTYSIIVNTLQGIGKYKLVIIGVLLGLIFNMIFDVPFMLLFNYFGLEPSWGAVFSGLIGYSLSMILTIIVLKKKYNFNIKSTINKLPSLVISWLIFEIVIVLLKLFIPIDLTGRLIQIPILAIYGVISFGIYALICYLNGNIKILFDMKKGKKK